MKKLILILFFITALFNENSNAQFINDSQQKILNILKSDNNYTSTKLELTEKGLIKISTYNKKFDITSTYLLQDDSCTVIFESIPISYIKAEQDFLKDNYIKLDDNAWINKDRKISIITKPIPENSVFFKTTSLIGVLNK